MATENPFTLARASDFTDKQINSLWTELGTPEIINTIIEPKSRVSKLYSLERVREKLIF